MPTPPLNGQKLRTVKSKMPKSLASGVEDFCKDNPKCLEPNYIPLYLIVLTIALCVDQQPSAALMREFSIANSKLRKEILGVQDDGQTIADLLS